MSNFPMREDLELRGYAKELGYTEKLDWKDMLCERFDVPHNAISFAKDSRHVWYCYKGWCVATLDKETNVYDGHRYFTTLKEALEVE